MRWVSGTGRGQALGHWLSRTIALPQLRRLTADALPWSPLQRPLREATVALVTTSGVLRRDDRPFKLASDPTFRVIPRSAEAGDLAGLPAVSRQFWIVAVTRPSASYCALTQRPSASRVPRSSPPVAS